jgi:hypothetical protein
MEAKAVMLGKVKLLQRLSAVALHCLARCLHRSLVGSARFCMRLAARPGSLTQCAQLRHAEALLHCMGDGW